MLYLSKGVLCKNSTTDEVRVARGNTVVTLTGLEAETWLSGRFNMISTDNKEKCSAIRSLYEMGLAEYEDATDETAQYYILTRCICCPAKTSLIKKPLSNCERTVMIWLDNAGLRLSTAELMYLVENKVKPTDNLFYEENAQALVETIYTKDTIFDNILENQMGHAKCRNEVVCSLLLLLSKKRIVML